MSKQVLEIEPRSELVFVGPFNNPVTTFMKLTNPTDNRVVYKIKTTAPKKYSVRPNSGVLDAKSSIQITITFQPAAESGEKIKHKFMVQSFVPPDGALNPEVLWKDLQPEKMMDTKLRCVFHLPEDQLKHSDSPESKLQPMVAEKKAETNEISVLMQLKQEESKLQKENFQLKEEILKLRQQANDGNKFSNKYQPPPLQANANSSFYIGFAFAMGLLGIILGKLIF